MTLVRFSNPRFTDFLDNWFENAFSDNRSFCGMLPATNIIEKDDAFVVEMAVPGMSKEDVKISLEGNMLTISSEKEMENTDTTYTRKEFSYSSFSRSFSLPKTIDADKISAEYDKGILKINLPKKEEAQRITKEIKIA